jgi:pyruvate dehydrogenase E2 component (dihydrolipoamide acetyltransferase)
MEPEAPAVEPTAPETVTREPLSRLRRLGAERTARSFSEVPHFYLTRDLEADRLVELQERLRRRMDPAPSVTDLLALAVSRTLRDHPRLNGRYAGDGELELHERVNLGIAVATEAGLVVPVLEGADALPLRELVPRARDLVRRAREGRLSPEELSGGTFTLTNLGMMGIDSFDAIINAPEAAILAVGRVRTLPEWREEKWVPKRVISGTLSVDHRVADGADGARFLAGMQAALSDWELLL